MGFYSSSTRWSLLPNYQYNFCLVTLHKQQLAAGIQKRTTELNLPLSFIGMPRSFLKDSSQHFFYRTLDFQGKKEMGYLEDLIGLATPHQKFLNLLNSKLLFISTFPRNAVLIYLCFLLDEFYFVLTYFQKKKNIINPRPSYLTSFCRTFGEKNTAGQLPQIGMKTEELTSHFYTFRITCLFLLLQQFIYFCQFFFLQPVH